MQLLGGFGIGDGAETPPEGIRDGLGVAMTLTGAEVRVLSGEEDLVDDVTAARVDEAVEAMLALEEGRGVEGSDPPLREEIAGPGIMYFSNLLKMLNEIPGSVDLYSSVPATPPESLEDPDPVTFKLMH